ncbi:lipid-A-disaccharide synthase [Ruegeria halocynthiae]|uniref:lipid-A-disaccharide synthase n=1 Tax=Ruegeria halocynthiae TaxID=985054 RepID=UPI00056A12C5|nr:lipid-A-disaccharide synthase [Ruegeria halocynthiae]
MRVFLVAGEPSGDRLGGALMEGLRALVPDITFDGVGGPLMQAQGLNSQFPMSELSVMGLVEVLPKFFHLKRRIAETAQAVLDTQPDVLITIDSPDFSLRVAKLVKAASDIRTVHYVAPSVWAWRSGRADKMAKVIDHVLALLPFEPPYMERAGMECDFVGHPVASEPVATDQEISDFRAMHGLADAPILLALPGSRRGEIDRLAPVFGEALSLYLKDTPDTRVVIPTVAHMVDGVTEHVQNWPGSPVVVDPRDLPTDQAVNQKRAAFAAADLALAASGTVSLELAAQATPMVIAYRLSWLTQKIAERMVKLDTVTLVNLVSETRTVPECLLDDCQPEMIASVLGQVSAAPNSQREAMATTMDRLGRGGEAPGLRAAKAILERMSA